LSEIDKIGLAYVSLTDPRSDMFMPEEDKIARLHEAARTRGLAEEEIKEKLSLRTFRQVLKKTVLMGNGGFTDKSCFAPVESGEIDAVAFGKWFISNPDLSERLRLGKELAPYRRDHFYSPGSVGYVDYPVWGMCACHSASK
jgi:N-ethylmaleimide reductase